MNDRVVPRASPWRAWAWPAFVVVASFVLYAPALEARFLADDLFQVSFVDGLFSYRPPFSLYFFALDDPANTWQHMERGTLPWWTVPHWRFAHLRPLSSLLLDFDYRVLPRDSNLHHVHSFLWLGATLLGAHLWLRRVITPAIAGVALLAIAFDESLAWTVAWLANRCAMISATFVAVAMWLHVRRREAPIPRAWDRLAVAELAAWALAFSAGEYAACGLGYLLAYELLGARGGGLRPRIVALVPAASVLAVFATVYLAIGCGVYGATTYVDPFTDFGVFASELWTRMSRMAGEVWLGLPGETERLGVRYDWTGVLPRIFDEADMDQTVRSITHAQLALASIACIVPTSWWLARRHLDAEERRVVAWMALGSVVSMIPLAAIPPATRALLLPTYGSAVFVGAVVVATVRAFRRPAGTLSLAIGRAVLPLSSLLLLLQHVVADAHQIRLQLRDLLAVQDSYRRFHDNDTLHAMDLSGRHVVVLATPGLVTGIHGLSMMNVLHRPMPASWHVLAMGARPYLVRKHDAFTIELSSVGEAMHAQHQETLFRAPRDGLHTGDTIDLPLFSAEVLHERKGEGPDAILFRFSMPLDDPRLVILAAGPDGLEPFTFPPGGRPAALKPPRLPGGPR